MRKEHPKGVSWPMTDDWKESVRNWLRDTKTERKELARRVGVDPSMITKMLSTSKPVYSAICVPAVCEVTGLPPPVIDFGDPRIRRLLEWAYLAKNGPEFADLLALMDRDAAASRKQTTVKKEIASAITRDRKDSRNSRR